MSKIKFSIVVSAFLFSDLFAIPFILEGKYRAEPVAGRNLIDTGARIKKDELDRDKQDGYYMHLDGGKNIKLSNDDRSTELFTRRYLKEYADDGYRFASKAYKSFSYTTNGTPSSIAIDYTSGRMYSFSFGEEGKTSSPTIGKNSNLFIKMESDNVNEGGNPIIQGMRIGFGEREVEDEAQFIGLSDSKSSFNLSTKSNVVISRNSFDKIYLNQGAAFNIKTAKDITFNNLMSKDYLTYSKKYYDDGLKHLSECDKDPLAKGYNEECNRIYAIGDNTKVSLNGENITNNGYLYAQGARGLVDIDAKTKFVNSYKKSENVKPIRVENEARLEEAYGVITAQNGGSVNIKSPSVTNEADSAFLNLGGKFNIDGDFINKGWLVAGQGTPTSEFSHFNVTGKTMLEDGSKIALAIYREKPVIGDQDILFLKSAKGIEGFDKLKSQDIKLLRIGKETDAKTKLVYDVINNTFDYDPNLSGNHIFKVELSNQNQNLYYRLALTKEALTKSIDEIIEDKKNEEKKKDFVAKLKSENKDSIEILNAIKATSKRYGPTVVSDYDKAFQGQKAIYDRLVENINAVSGSMETFNAVLDTMPLIKSMHFNTQMNIASRMVKFKNEPFAHAMPIARDDVLAPKIYDQNPATNTKKVLSSSKGKRSLIVMADVEKELVNRVKNQDQKRQESTKNDTKAVKNYETQSSTYDIDMPSSFWFNALNSKGDLKNGDLDLFGFSLGFDKRYDNHIAGIYALGANSKIALEKAAAEVKSKNIQFGGYGRVFIDDVEIDLNGFYNFGTNKVKRNFAFYGEPIKYSSKGDVHTFGGGASVGYVFDLGDDFYLKPSIGLNAYISKTPEYKERGDLAFSKDGGTDSSVNAFFGAEFRKHFYNGNYFYIVPGIEKELSRSENNVVKFSGYETAFTAKTNNKKQTYATIYGGTELKISDTFLFNLNLGTKIGKDEKYYNVNAGFKLQF